MWFLIRSAFWLGLVFAKIDWPADTPVPPDSGAIASAAAAGVASLCAEHPVPCARAARQAMSLTLAPPPIEAPREAIQIVAPPRKSRGAV